VQGRSVKNLSRSSFYEGDPAGFAGWLNALAGVSLPVKGSIQFLRFQSSTLKRLSFVHQPVLIFQGRQDLTVAPDAGKIIMNGVSSEIKEHHWMEKSSHSILLDEEYEDVAEMSWRFIERNGK
jgi:esterase/lipase